jgi:hypothetical protein
MPAFVLGVGLLGMGLAWAGGVSLEGRRHGTARAFCALGIAAGVLAFAPALAGPLGGARFVFLAIAALSAGGIVALARAQGLNRSSS